MRCLYYLHAKAACWNIVFAVDEVYFNFNHGLPPGPFCVNESIFYFFPHAKHIQFLLDLSLKLASIDYFALIWPSTRRV